MKQLSTIFTFAVVLALFTASCNNKPKAQEETTAAVTDTAAKAKPAFKPYKAMLIIHTVADYDKWLVGFNAHDTARKANGISPSYVGRGIDNDKLVVVYSVVTDLQKAKDFTAAPGMADVMKKAGVTGKPTMMMADIIRDDTTSIPQQERIMITHHVKDFDTWLKAYDAEGMAARSADGLVDRGMARNVDDPNTVTVLFAVTDMAKARARVASPELKKIMTDGGVDGPPTITWFKWQN